MAGLQTAVLWVQRLLMAMCAACIRHQVTLLSRDGVDQGTLDYCYRSLQQSLCKRGERSLHGPCLHGAVYG